MKKNMKIKLIILFAFMFLFSRGVLAASLELNVEKNVLKIGDVFTMTIFLNTDGQSINTIEGDLNYDQKFFGAETINLGSSFVNLWVEKPDIKTTGTIHFSGITPGGITTPRGEVFKVIFKAENAGDTNLLLNNVNLFLNDGNGSAASAKIKNVSLKINQSGGISQNINMIPEDLVAPGKFSIMRTRSSSLFDNKWFLVFSTTDKESGIDHYQICELFSCATGDSPFLLKNQTPFYRVTVSAYDMNGNFTSSTITSPWLILVVILFFLVVFFISFCFYRGYLHFNKV
jgi:hypothetical protein